VTVRDLNSALQAPEYPQRFKDIQPFIFEWEVVTNRAGKILIEDDPSDPGGATFCGLDKRSHPNLNFRTMSAEDVCSTYLEKYWNRFDCEHYPFPLGEAFYNCAVNCGSGRADKIIKTSKSAAQFIACQAEFYQALTRARPSLHKFLAGWENRLNALREHLHI